MGSTSGSKAIDLMNVRSSLIRKQLAESSVSRNAGGVGNIGVSHAKQIMKLAQEKTRNPGYAQRSFAGYGVDGSQLAFNHHPQRTIGGNKSIPRHHGS